MTFGLLIVISLMVVVFLAAAIMYYQKLKKLFLEKGFERARDHTFVDLIFHDRLKNEPAARKLRKRVISLFGLSVVMVHVAMLLCGACHR